MQVPMAHDAGGRKPKLPAAAAAAGDEPGVRSSRQQDLDRMYLSADSTKDRMGKVNYCLHAK